MNNIMIKKIGENKYIGTSENGKAKGKTIREVIDKLLKKEIQEVQK